jgi:hypothetical protein
MDPEEPLSTFDPGSGIEPAGAPSDEDFSPTVEETRGKSRAHPSVPFESETGETTANAASDLDIQPVDLPRNPPPGRRASVIWTIGSILAAGLIVIEALAISRHGGTPDLASLSPTLESPSSGRAPLSPARVRILSAEVRQTPHTPGVLEVEGTLFNASSHGLAFPQLLIRFTNLEGQILVEGLFPPVDYLLARPHNPVIPAHGAVAFRIRVVDPGQQAVGFNLRSCLPPKGNTTYCGDL